MKNFQTAPAFLLVFIFLLGGCFLFDDTDTDDIVVKSVSVSPSTANVNKGATCQFTATVSGTGNPAQTVTWSVNGVSGTNISSAGLLTVAANETAVTLTVKATSTVDTSKSGTATVTVTSAPAATVTSVSVNPSTASVAHGGTQTFTATVTGTNSPAQTVTWSVTGGARAATAITSAGVLSVASNETAATLTVRATSTVDTTKSGTATVTVTSATATVTGVSVSPSTATVSKGRTLQFSATVSGTNSPAQTVTWSIVESGKHSGTTINSSGLLTISASETLTSLTVRAASTVDTTKSGTAAVTVSQMTTPVTPTDSRILNPAATNTQLSNSSFALVTKPHGGGNKWLVESSRLGYETWDEDSTGDANFRWYGTNQGGGAAFRAEWGSPNRPKDFLARVGYFWNQGNPHTFYGNIYCGFNFTKSGQYRGNFSYIGIYGWSRNPTVEYYIVENSYGNAWNDHAGYIARLNQDTIQGDDMGSYTLDGSVYRVYRKSRTGPSIEGNNTSFTQFFSIRQTARTNGTISVTEHFNEWDKLGMHLGSNMYECKFKVEVGGTPSQNGGSTTGWFDATLIQFYRANDDGTIIQITQ